mgnify:CR=1 FL=1
MTQPLTADVETRSRLLTWVPRSRASRVDEIFERVSHRILRPAQCCIALYDKGRRKDLLLGTSPFTLIYRVAPNQIEILRLWDTRQGTGY